MIEYFGEGNLSWPDEVKGILDELLCACIDIVVVTPLSEFCDSIYNPIILYRIKPTFDFNAECCIQWNGLDPVTKTEVFA